MGSDEEPRIPRASRREHFAADECGRSRRLCDAIVLRHQQLRQSRCGRRHMMQEQIAIPASSEVDRGRVISSVMLPVSRADRSERRISIVRYQALTHDRCKNDEPHGEKAKPGGHSLAGMSDHDGGHRGSGSILAETGSGGGEIPVCLMSSATIDRIAHFPRWPLDRSHPPMRPRSARFAYSSTQ